MLVLAKIVFTFISLSLIGLPFGMLIDSETLVDVCLRGLVIILLMIFLSGSVFVLYCIWH